MPLSAARPPAWFDPVVCEEARTEVLAQLSRGRRRVLLWGPPGVGRTTLLARLAGEAGVRTVDAGSHAEAAAALADAGEDAPTVVAAVSRAGLDADAFVEFRALSADDTAPRSAWAFLLRCLSRDGLAAIEPAPDAARAALRRVVAHAEGLPGALARAAALLRLMPAAALADRCDRAARDLALFGRLSEHPLLTGEREDVRPLDDEARRVGAALVAAGEPLDTEAAAALAARHASPPARALDALLALRDAGALRVHPDGRVALWGSAARALARWPGFPDAFAAEAAHLDGESTAAGRAARLRWLTAGDPDALARIAREAGRLERAALRALESKPGDGARLADAVLALRAATEIRSGARPDDDDDLLRRALETLGGRGTGGAAELQLEWARTLRTRGDLDGAEAALRPLDPAALPPEIAGAWHGELAQVLLLRRELEPSVAHAGLAVEAFARAGWRHAEARMVNKLGSARYYQERFAEAREHFERVRALAARLDARHTEAVALSNLCLCDTVEGDERAATAHALRAIEVFRALGDAGAHGVTVGHLARVAFNYGRLDDASRYFADAEALVQAAAFPEQLAFLRFNRAELAMARGRLDEASERLAALEAVMAEHPDPIVMPHLDALLGELMERQGRHEDALAALERGWARGPSVQPAVLADLAARRARVLARLGAVGASRAAADEARGALRDDTKSEIVVAVALALAHAARLRGEGGDHAALADALRPAWEGLAARARVGVSAADSWPVRAAAGLYWQDLAPAERVAVEWRARDPRAQALCLDEAAGRARTPGGGEIDAASRRNAYRLLALLAAAGGAPRGRDALVAALWPGEKIRGDAAANRLHNAVAQLRAAGLGGHLLRDADGYRLDPGLRVVRAAGDDPLARVPVAG